MICIFIQSSFCHHHHHLYIIIIIMNSEGLGVVPVP